MTLQEINQRINEIMTARNTRKWAAINTHMGSEFPTLPMETLASLQDQLAFYNSVPESLSVQTLKQSLQSKIDNQEYCQPNTPEWTYREQYYNKLSLLDVFSQEEQTLREQEDLEIKNLWTNFTPGT